MIPYDGSHDDQPVDVASVSADDVLLERLRRSLSPESAVVWDDQDDELDPVFALLRAVQRDVGADLPAPAPGVAALLPRQRRFGRGATIAMVTAGVLSIGGVAAAAPGSPLSGVRSAVSTAVTGVVEAITPSQPVGPKITEPSPVGTPTPRADQVRSASAVQQVTAELDKAARLLDRGQRSAAQNQLDAAARKLPLVLDAAPHDRLAARLAALRARLAAGHSDATPGRHGDDATQGDDTRKSTGGRDQSDSGKTDPSKPDPGKTDPGKTDPGKNESGRNKVNDDPAQQPASEVEPSRAPHATEIDTSGQDAGHPSGQDAGQKPATTVDGPEAPTSHG